MIDLKQDLHINDLLTLERYSTAIIAVGVETDGSRTEQYRNLISLLDREYENGSQRRSDRAIELKCPFT